MELLTTKETCKILMVSERTLRRWMKEGLPYSQARKRGKLLFSKKKLLEYLEENQVPMPIHLKFQRLMLIGRK
ncbi:MAG: helix-turn-helix domain-containing protein [Candidatus Aminicenantes bacterium]|nr:MAG: helix-turn-helix domain-containing protein [Candidatus Aminicenantes bacterium]